jgi:hypothetical protein
MADAMLLPAAVLVLGLVSVLFFELPRHLGGPQQKQADPTETPTPVLD